MATLVQVPNSKKPKDLRLAKWKAVIRKDGSYIGCKTFKHKADAKAWATQQEAMLDSGQHPSQLQQEATPSVSFGQVVEEYKDSLTLKSTRTVKQQADWWKGKLGADAPVADLTDDVLQDVLAELGQTPTPRGNPRSPATLNRYASRISAILEFARRRPRRYIDKNPASELLRQTEPKGRVRYLSDDERKRLHKAARASSWGKLYLLILMASQTGCRRSEMAWLEWQDIDFDKRTTILKDTKNGTDRLVSFPPAVASELSKFRQDEGLVFNRPDDPMQPFYFQKQWLAALKAAKIEDFRFHDLRHDCASSLAMANASTIQIATVLGHKSLQTTARYAHLSPGHQQQLTDEVFGGVS